MTLRNARENISGECTRLFTKCDGGYLLTDPGRPPFDGKIDVGLACVDSDFGSYCRALPRLT